MPEENEIDVEKSYTNRENVSKTAAFSRCSRTGKNL